MQESGLSGAKPGLLSAPFYSPYKYLVFVEKTATEKIAFDLTDGHFYVYYNMDAQAERRT